MGTWQNSDVSIAGFRGSWGTQALDGPVHFIVSTQPFPRCLTCLRRPHFDNYGGESSSGWPWDVE